MALAAPLSSPDTPGLAVARAAGEAWARRPVAERLRIIRSTRRRIAADCEALAASVGSRRAVAETLVTEVLPLADAARFLERHAARLLAPKRPVGIRPLWMLGVEAEIRREALGVVLILAPSNYPLFLPGVQVLQALVGGNAVHVKPAPGCAEPMQRLAAILEASGLPAELLTLLPDTVEAGSAAAAAGYDRIVLTGSAATGRAVLRQVAEGLTPATMELSGCDAAFILPGADLPVAASCLAYGMRLNGGATCIAPRRVFVTEPDAPALEAALQERLAAIPPAPVPARIRRNLEQLLREAEAAGATASAQPDDPCPPILVRQARPGMTLLRTDVFAPVLSVVKVPDMQTAIAMDAECPFALGASVFGPRNDALALAGRIKAGAVVINDLIVPTADPRLAFGGRGESGFGVTRGAEGLLEMTAIKTISTRRGRFRPHLSPPQPTDHQRFVRMIRILHRF